MDISIKHRRRFASCNVKQGNTSWKIKIKFGRAILCLILASTVIASPTAEEAPVHIRSSHIRIKTDNSKISVKESAYHCTYTQYIKCTSPKIFNSRPKTQNTPPRLPVWCRLHYSDVIIGAVTSQITSLTIVYSTVYSGADQRKHQSSASLAFVRGIHRSPVNSPHRWPVTRKMFPFDDVIM